MSVFFTAIIQKNNKFWHSQYKNVNTITNIEPRGTCYGLYVYKTGCSNGIDLNIQLNSTQSGLKGTSYDYSQFEYTVYADSACRKPVGKLYRSLTDSVHLV